MMTTTTEKSRVLVVDDEPQITRVLRTVLTSQGYQVRTAAEGQAALSSFTEWRPELVITDLYMPHMDGIELVSAIRADRSIPFFPVIFLSAMPQEARRARGLGAASRRATVYRYSTRVTPWSSRTLPLKGTIADGETR